MKSARIQHEEKFGVEPVIIGMYFYDPEQMNRNIIKAVKQGNPYDEYKLLSSEDKKDYDNGNLLF